MRKSNRQCRPLLSNWRETWAHVCAVKKDLMELSFDTLETPALTKAQLAELLFEQIGLNKRESKEMIDALFDLITQKLVQGEEVKISGFGNFQIRTKSPRPGRNPRTGEPIPIEARRVVTFHASHKLKDQIQSGHSQEVKPIDE